MFNHCNRKRKNSSVNTKQKIEIINYMEKNKGISFVNVASKFSNQFNLKISPKSVTNYLKSKDKIRETAQINVNRMRNSIKSKYDNINQSLFEKIQLIEACGGVYNERILKAEALHLAKEMRDNTFCASNGWLQSFKDKYGIRLKVLSGESNNLNRNDFNEFYQNIKTKMERYRDADIFNCDETALFYKQAPSKSLMAKTRKGLKSCKDRVTCLFCVNLDGTEKKKPLIIGKYKTPRSFRHFNYKKFCDYYHNNTAWMTSKIFNEWIMKWDEELLRLNRKIILLCDNCPAHKMTFEPKHIEIVFLPRNSTSITQPLDKGIIRSFKSKYFHWLISNVVSQLKPEMFACNIFKSFTIRDCVVFCSWAWEEVSKKTIANCWENAGYDFRLNIETEQSVQCSENNDSLDAEINKLGFGDAVSIVELVDDFISENDLIFELSKSKTFVNKLTNDEKTVLQYIPNELDEDSESHSTDDIENEEMNGEELKVSFNVAYDGFLKFKEFMLSCVDVSTEQLNGLKEYDKYFMSKICQKRKITDYFNVVNK